MKMTDIKIGADPEIWIVDKSKDKIISAHGLFPGTKDDPFKVDGGAIQVDGMAAEFNIDPSKTAKEFQWNITKVLGELRYQIHRNNPWLDFDFSFSPVAEFTQEYMDAQPEEAKRLGCTPDFSAWNRGKANKTPDNTQLFRTASGHIHVGWTYDEDISDADHLEACMMMVRQLDFMVTVPLIMSMNDEQRKLDAKRRKLYGKAGAFRPKHYGVEYRTPSSFWLTDPFYVKMVFEASVRAFEDLVGGDRAYEYLKQYDTLKYINRCNADGLGGEGHVPWFRPDVKPAPKPVFDHAPPPQVFIQPAFGGVGDRLVAEKIVQNVVFNEDNNFNEVDAFFERNEDLRG
jgi:hypothetical protein